MFYQTYKTTIKNITRSKTFWFAVMLLFIIALYEAIRGGYGYYDHQLNEVIMDTDPRYVMRYPITVQDVANTCYSLLYYVMPIVSVIAAVSVLSRDYGDSFFEIEKTRGVKTLGYLTGRLAGLITVTFPVYISACFLRFYWYVFSRGGIDGMGTAEMLADTIPRLIRDIVTAGFSCILLYICLTYVVGSIFKNAVMGAAAGIGYVVAYYAARFVVKSRIDPFYFDYLSPIPDKLRYYLHYYDTEWFEETIASFETNLAKAMMCIGILLGVSLIYCTITYFRIRKRDV